MVFIILLALLDARAAMFSEYSMIDSTFFEQLLKMFPCARAQTESNVFFHTLGPLILVQ